MLKAKLIFVIVGSLLLFISLAVQHHLEILHRQQTQLHQTINELQQLHNETLEDLTLSYSENDELYNKLGETIEHSDLLQRRNLELEQILFNQTQTYRKAVAMKGATMPVLTPSSFTAPLFERAWRNLRAYGLKGTGDALQQAEETYGINSLVLAAIAFLESGAGKSRIAREKNNLFGLGAGGPNPFRSALSFETRDCSVYFTARLLRNSYLTRGGRFYYGDNIRAVNVRYAEDPLWADKVARSMAQIARSAIPGGR